MSSFPEVLNNLTPELAHAWHPVALVEEVGEQPLQVRLLGESWVLVRVAGKLMALRDQCPHRNAPLSAGCVIDGALECPYHGWRFADDGHCVHIPAMGTQVPPKSTAAQAPAGLEVRYGLVWLAPRPPKVPLIEIPEWSDSKFRTEIMPPLRTRASAAQIVDNFLDVTHFYYLHGKSFGLTSPDPIRSYHVERNANEVVLHHQTFF
ncbi:MAG: Rieske 2Fe-2S domain-containing protein, partial [Porticoccaceae bacterium]